MIQNMIFVSNNHILVQFDSRYTPQYNKKSSQISRKSLYQKSSGQTILQQNNDENSEKARVSKTIIVKMNGMIVPQNRKVDKYLGG